MVRHAGGPAGRRCRRGESGYESWRCGSALEFFTFFPHLDVIQTILVSNDA
jgi:hypothetical protein